MELFLHACLILIDYFRQALVHFNSIEEATRAVEATKDVSVNGDMLSVGFHK